jgi:hypothetical protein
MLQERVSPPTSVGNTLGNARALTETQSEMLYSEHPDCCLTRNLSILTNSSLLLKLEEIWVPLQRHVPIITPSKVPTPSEVPSNTPNFSPDNAFKPSAEVKKSVQPKPTFIAANPQELEKMLQHSIQTEESIPDGLEFKETIGKKAPTYGKALMYPHSYAENHPAAELLTHYAEEGCPVDCGIPWTEEHIIKALLHGPHNSAQGTLARQALISEARDKVRNGHAKIVRWGDIKDDIPEELKLSPAACIPHKSKSFRVILDLSFNLFCEGKVFPSVNEATTKLAPQQSMVQLGNCLKRIIATMNENYNPLFPFKFCKLDIKDGFWRLVVSKEAAWNFSYVLPSVDKTIDIDDIEIVVPTSLQMGWCESPPFFCAASETARDVICDLIQSKVELPPHKFEHKMMPDVEPLEDPPTAGEITLQEVFVDDFIGVTNNITPAHLLHVSRAMLHGVHSVFPPVEMTQHPGGDSIAENKIDKGDGKWEFKKEILGWIFDGINYTMQLPAEKCDKIIKLIKKVIALRNVLLKRFLELSGKLQNASIGMPGGAGLFSPMQMAVRGSPDFVIMDEYMKSNLRDWRSIIHYMKKNPTAVQQLASGYPNYIGYSDSCGLGTGGVWTPGLSHIPFTVWQYEWPQDIKDRLITDQNPSGDLTINDFELAGVVLNFLVLELSAVDLQWMHIGAFCDNFSAVSWASKMRTSKSIASARLLRMLGLRILAAKASSHVPLPIAGEDNDMADVTSRAFKNGKFFRGDISLTTFFNTKFPLPQNNCWTELTIPKKLISRVMSCLRGEQLTMESLLRLPQVGKNTGNTGQDMPDCSKKIHSSQTPLPLNKESSSQLLLQGSGQGSTVEEMKSKFHQSVMRSQPSPRPSNWLENKVRSTGTKKRTHSQSNDASKECDD